MDTQSKLLNNRKAALMKQYKLNAAKDRLKKNIPNFSSIIYCDNNGRVLVTKNDETCGYISDVKYANGSANIQSTNIKSNGKKLSPLQVNKMYSTYRCSWAYGEKSYVSKPGCIDEVKSSENGKIGCSLSDVDGFPGKDQELNDFFFNIKEDYSTKIFNGKTIQFLCKGTDKKDDSGERENAMMETSDTNLSSIKYVNEKITFKYEKRGSIFAYFRFYFTTGNDDNLYYKLSSLFLNCKDINRPVLIIDYNKKAKNMILYNSKRKSIQVYNETDVLPKYCDHIDIIGGIKRYYGSYANYRNSYYYYAIDSQKEEEYYDYFFNGQFIGEPLINSLTKIYDTSSVEYIRLRFYNPGTRSGDKILSGALHVYPTNKNSIGSVVLEVAR